MSFKKLLKQPYFQKRDVMKTKIASSIIFVWIFFLSINAIGSSLDQIQSLIDKFGKREIADFILKNSQNNQITVQVQNKLYLRYGSPGLDYITVYSIRNDLKNLGIRAENLDYLISKKLNKKRLKTKITKKEPKNNFLTQKKSKLFIEKAHTFFSKSKMVDIKFENGSGRILFKKDNLYFGTGDKINKIAAIESARLFRDVPELKKLMIFIPLFNKTHMLSITRHEIEDHYNLNLVMFNDNLDAWRREFIQKYDSKKLRSQFASKFIQVLTQR